jgi:hypothetical protein
MKILISCNENPKIYFEVMEKSGVFIDKEVILDDIFFCRAATGSVCPIL